MDLKNRLKSIPLWTAFLGLVYLVAKNWFGFDIPGWADISASILSILAILFGAANNPTVHDRF